MVHVRCGGGRAAVLRRRPATTARLSIFTQHVSETAFYRTMILKIAFQGTMVRLKSSVLACVLAPRLALRGASRTRSRSFSRTLLVTLHVDYVQL